MSVPDSVTPTARAEQLLALGRRRGKGHGECIYSTPPVWDTVLFPWLRSYTPGSPPPPLSPPRARLASPGQKKRLRLKERDGVSTSFSYALVELGSMSRPNFAFAGGGMHQSNARGVAWPGQAERTKVRSMTWRYRDGSGASEGGGASQNRGQGERHCRLQQRQASSNQTTEARRMRWR